MVRFFRPFQPSFHWQPPQAKITQVSPFSDDVSSLVTESGIGSNNRKRRLVTSGDLTAFVVPKWRTALNTEALTTVSAGGHQSKSETCLRNRTQPNKQVP